MHGWKPRGTEPSVAAASRERFAYYEPSRRILEEDARELAHCLESALADVPDDIVPLQGRRFGEENTLDLIRRAADGHAAPKGEAGAALEILSGPPKTDAVQLVQFLRAGEFHIRPPAPSRRTEPSRGA